jgi:hypothetical protein
MWIIGLAWVYVVGLMALTEPTVVAGVLTFLAYAVLPLALLWYIFFRPAMRRAAQARAHYVAATDAATAAGHGAAAQAPGHDGADQPAGDAPAPAAHLPADGA